MAEFGGDIGRATSLRPLLAVLVLAAILTVELGLDWTGYAAPPAATAAERPPVDPASRIIELLGPAPAYDAFLAAPVLDAERAPIILPGAAAGSNSAGGQVILLGTVVAGNGRVALFRIQGETGIIRARPGEMVGGWRVTDLEARGVRLERSGESMQLTLPDFDNGGQ